MRESIRKVYEGRRMVGDIQALKQLLGSTPIDVSNFPYVFIAYLRYLIKYMFNILTAADHYHSQHYHLISFTQPEFNGVQLNLIRGTLNASHLTYSG